MTLVGGAYWHSLVYLIAVLSFIFSDFAQGSPLRPGSPVVNVSSLYVPSAAKCPSTPLVRKADGLSPLEASYITQRKRLASKSLGEWLQQTNAGFGISDMPTVALASSGGGYRAMIAGAGIVQAFDNRDSKAATKGIYQGLTYHAGLSGGAWMLSSFIGNDYEPIKSLSSLWQDTLLKNSLWPLNTETSPEYPQVKRDIKAKSDAGYPPTTTDAWGRFFSYQLFRGSDGGVTKTLSSIASSPGFVNFSQPYPIITALGANSNDINAKVCDAQDDATQYEFHPYEFGSWDKGVEAFASTEYLGTRFSNGKPTQSDQCVRNFDNLGYILGTSSNRFNEGCGGSAMAAIASGLDPIIQSVHNATRRDLYAPYPNPFKDYPGSPLVSKSDELYLVDGGQSNQNNPIWPLLQPSRAVDVLIVNDNSADTDDNWPNGTEIIHTYVEAKRVGLTRMPVVPDLATFMTKGLYQRASFFGCNKKDQITIVFLPNAKFTYQSNIPTSQFDYEKKELLAMIENSVQIATQGGDPEWPTCLGCAIVHKSAKSVPTQCAACLQKYCF